VTVPFLSNSHALFRRFISLSFSPFVFTRFFLICSMESRSKKRKASGYSQETYSNLPPHPRKRNYVKKEIPQGIRAVGARLQEYLQKIEIVGKPWFLLKPDLDRKEELIALFIDFNSFNGISFGLLTHFDSGGSEGAVSQDVGTLFDD
jgi:hypothetical protein